MGIRTWEWERLGSHGNVIRPMEMGIRTWEWEKIKRVQRRPIFVHSMRYKISHLQFKYYLSFIQVDI